MGQYSGISYSIDGKGIQYPHKMTTVNSSMYPLLDTHFIDWDSSKLWYLSHIDKTLINAFAYNVSPNDQSAIGEIRLQGGDAQLPRLRYNNEFDRDDERDGMPLWNKYSYITNSAELLDIIDFLTWASTYSFGLIKNLYEIESTTTPVLSFYPEQISYYGGKLTNGNVDENGMISIGIVSNQCEDKFKAIIEKDGYMWFSDNSRKFTLNILAKNKFGEYITESFYYTLADGHTNLCYSPDYVGSSKNNPFTIETSIISSTGIVSDITQKVFAMTFVNEGWEPEIDEMQPSGYDDTRKYVLKIYSDQTTSVADSKTFLKSNILELAIEAKKASNDFTHIFINNVRYFYLGRSFFDNSTYLDIYRFKGYSFLISEKSLSESEMSNLTYVVFDNNPSLFDELVSADTLMTTNGEESGFLYIANNKNTTFKIFPKYYGYAIDSKNADILSITENTNPAWNGDYDYASGNKNENNRVKCLPLSYYNEIINNGKQPNVTISNVTDIIEEIDGIKRKGFEFTVLINNTGNSNNGIYDCKSTFNISTTPSLFIAGTKLSLCIKTQITQNVIFVDMKNTSDVQVKLDDKELKLAEIISSKEEIKIDEIDIKSLTDKEYGLSNESSLAVNTSIVKLDNGYYKWDFKLPLYSARSWGSDGTTASVMSLISPNTINEGYGLSKPTNEFSIKEFISGDDKTKYSDNGYPGLLLGYKLNYIGGDYQSPDTTREAIELKLINKMLCGAYTLDYSNNKKGYKNVSYEIEFDYEETYLLNAAFIQTISDAELKSQLMNASLSKKEKGKLLVSRYCGICKRTENAATHTAKLKYLVFYKPTVPDNEISNNYEANWSFNNNMLKIALVVNESTSGTGESSFYASQICTLNLIVTRASFEYAGWAYKKKTSELGSTLQQISFNKKILVSDIISNKDFSGSNANCIQTRLTSDFIPCTSYISADNTYSYISTSVVDSLTDETYTISYKYFPDKKSIEFVNSFEKNSYNEWEYRIDYNISQLSVDGYINSDNSFIGKYPNNSMPVRISLVRENNKVFNIKNEIIWEVSPISISSNDMIICMRGEYHTSINNLLDENNIPKFSIMDLFSKNSEEYAMVYGSYEPNELMQISATGAFYKNITETINDNRFIDNIWQPNPDYMARLSRLIKGKMNKLEKTTDYGFNLMYDMYDNEIEDIEKYITFSHDTLIFDKEKFNNAYTTNDYKYLRLRLVTVMPMTHTYRGNVIDLKLQINFD